MPRDNIAAFRPHWPAGLKQAESYRLLCDDNKYASLRVLIGPDGDVWLTMEEPRVSGATGELEIDPEMSKVARCSIPALDPHPSLRCRTYAGGGRHLRTHQALLWLALAIKLDNADLGVTE